ncbi:TPA: hypothetical protein O5W62_000014 [Staphylococcus aureus]|nr:hypothetical protein [Staphylococcus aureus]HCZ0184280.1 hypothetical protein [Staphylococcus aureus]HDA0846779.1 hypothetical protein [Staphylococcus aureus]HDA2728080.1 hypothetical protein [Staphylococcus aureus]HDA7999530.1 hypothetical protein [Staphylococcus aureus]
MGKLKEIQKKSIERDKINFIQYPCIRENDRLTLIRKSEKVGILGLGLSFYDVMAELTIGRGGNFKENEDGTLIYIKSGNEPKIFASSRSGFPVPARGKNQKNSNYNYVPAIFTQKRAETLKRRGSIYFDKEVLPLIEAELSLVYAQTLFANNNEMQKSSELRKLVIDHNVTTAQGVQTFCDILGLNELIRINLYDWKYPFQNCKFKNIDQFQKYLLKLISKDINDALQGNMNSPKKTALDVLRNIRNIIRIIADYGRIHCDSYNSEFLKKFDSAMKFLSAGPPLKRLLQLQALIKADVVKIIGPNLDYYFDDNENKVCMYSKNVSDSFVNVTTFIDARIPSPSLQNDNSILIQNMLKRNIISPFVNYNGNQPFETPGINITESPFHPINNTGDVLYDFYIIGIPTEFTRWFMQSGSTKPNKWIDFMIDADEIAKDILGLISIKKEMF